MTVGIIGTAGRDRSPKLCQELYGAAVERVVDLLLDGRDVQLVSGGAAWMDHIAVSVSRHYSLPIHLYLPAPWDASRQQYLDTGVRDWKTNPGGTANHYHRVFEDTTGIPSLAEIGELVRSGAVTVRHGFQARNADVAAVDRLIALTWGEGPTPMDGGTKHTWDLSTAVKTHVPLGGVYRDAKIGELFGELPIPVFERTPDAVWGFQGPHRYLSNFWDSPVTFPCVASGGSQVFADFGKREKLPSGEHLYHFYKWASHPHRLERIREAKTPGEAKRAGQGAPPLWHQHRLSAMRFVLESKFVPGLAPARFLVETGDRPLVEYNTWGDTFWGVTTDERGGYQGHNWLGRLLMDRRAALRRM